MTNKKQSNNKRNMSTKFLHRSLCLLVISLFFAVSNVSIAQRFSFTPTNTWDQEYYKDSYSSNQITLTNETTEALAFRWKFVANTFPAEWTFSICDLGSCFPIPPDSNDMSLTTVGGDAYFICHTSFNGFIGAGEIQLFVFELGDEAQGDTVTFRYSTTNVVGTETLSLSKPDLALFPNPTSDFVNLITAGGTEIGLVIVYNILGQPVFEKKMGVGVPGQAIPVGYLNPGQYFLSVMYTNGERETRVFYKANL